jgi:hypothetical protein
MKDFRGDLISMQTKLKDGQPFAFSRFGDGELRILTGELRRYPEFRFDPADPGYVFLRERLFESFRYQSESYYVGIPCPGCVGKERFLWAKQMCGQPEAQLTWATLFVNSNYAYFKENVVPLFSSYPVYLVCHTSATPENLPFAVIRDFRVEKNAWRTNFNLAHQLTELIARDRIRGVLFVLCAGPFANILAHKLHAQSKENTYLDAGSTLDPFLFGAKGLTRRYLKGEQRFVRRTCTWN